MSDKQSESLVKTRPNHRQVWYAAVASTLGNSFDAFDLFILLYVAPELGKLFFPSTDPILSLAVVYASFAVTLLMRPLGSAIFGSYADRFGRKRAMTFATVGAGISTALFGALPTVHQIGVTAAVVFLILRLVQGVFIGGVIASSHTVGTESVSRRWRGLMSGIVISGAGLGSFLASMIYSVISAAFPGPEFEVWGWRFMFFSGIITAGLGWFVHKNLEESPFFKAHNRQLQKGEIQPSHSPLRILFTQYRSKMLINLMIVVGGGSAYYITSGFMPTFLKVVNRLSGENLSLGLLAASIIGIIASVTVVCLSDWIGRKKTFILVGVLSIVGIPYFYSALAQTGNMAAILFYVSALAFLGNAAISPIMIFLNERYPTAIRATGTALTWNLGFALGGMMPTFLTLASGSTANFAAMLGYFSIGLFIIYLLGSFIIPETKGHMEEAPGPSKENASPAPQVELHS